MFSNKKRQEFLSREYVWLWGALAFQAGFANAGGFLACSKFVSHMTGFGTQVGISLSKLDYLLAIEMFSAPASFLAGAMVSALVVDRPMLKGRKPRYLSVMLSMVLIFTLVTLGGINGLFGEFGEPLLLKRDFALMSLLCFACGMQNACFGSLTRGQIRTTHLTGILTDMGTSFVKIFYLDAVDRQTKFLKRVNFIRILTFLSFSCGSAASAILFTRMQYSGFWVLVGFSAFLFGSMALKQKSLDERAVRRKAFKAHAKAS